ncbi:hypothetical protein SteCoe_21814 [Stentor coeruleus]|uniref:MARVEL domain-containing protein n=1 Tax=Stentor coeruleus TaxID=5963 RepID=A0A1R2BNN3_9CILI|nr:hypothetical protein SteCoe_21814 [Stentor coeruleus]
MDSNKKIRIFGGVITLLAMAYYGYQIYLYLSNWYSLDDIQEDTACDEIFTLELWLLSQNIIWLTSLGFLMIVLIIPEFYKLLLCFLYLMGPVYLTWTFVAIGYYSWFLGCCNSEQDSCVDYYPYLSPAGFIALIIVSVVFSALITIYLLSIIIQTLWGYIRTRYQNYTDLYF